MALVVAYEIELHLRIEIIILRFHRVMKNITFGLLVFHHSMKPRNNDFNSYIYILIPFKLYEMKLPYISFHLFFARKQEKQQALSLAREKVIMRSEQKLQMHSPANIFKQVHTIIVFDAPSWQK